MKSITEKENNTHNMSIVKKQLEISDKSTVSAEKEELLKPAAASWSGGIDCCMAVWRALKEGVNVRYLYTAVPEGYDRVSVYGLRTYILTLQAEAMGMTHILKKVNDENFRRQLIDTLSGLKQKKIEGMVFGDIDLQDEVELKELRLWGQDLCRETGLNALHPLWKEDQKELLREFISQGFKAIVIGVDSRFFGPETLGREIDESWVNEIGKLGNVSHCGAEDEYYTMVYDGPLFKNKMKITQGRKVLAGQYWLLELHT